MEFEDSRFALFAEPNAYIQKAQNVEKKEKERKKIVFQEPYEILPNFYVNNNFTKQDCDCVKKNKHCDIYPKPHHECNHSISNNTNCGCGFDNDLGCRKENCGNLPNHNDNCHNDKPKQNGFGFDLKSLLPLLSLFNKGGADLSSIVGLLNNKENNQNGTTNLISSILSNKDVMSGILNMFNGGGLNLFGKKQAVKKQLKTTDFEIKNYTRVE